MIKSRPIIFGTPMIKAILENRKTQTRRTLNPQPDGGIHFEPFTPHGVVNGKGEPLECRFGRKGDRLWVRETWNHSNHPDGSYEPDCHVFYRADYMDDPLGADLEKSSDGIRRKWKCAIHMPRSASRILLEITNIRVERLQDITEEDAIAEGLKAITKDNGITIKYGIPDSDGLPGEDDLGWPWRDWNKSPIDAYRTLWESINGKESWSSNPYVWVIEFKRINDE